MIQLDRIQAISAGDRTMSAGDRKIPSGFRKNSYASVGRLEVALRNAPVSRGREVGLRLA